MSSTGNDVEYYDRVDYVGEFDVVFLNQKGVKLVKRFSSPYHARNFVNRARRGRKITLVSYP